MNPTHVSGAIFILLLAGGLSSAHAAETKTAPKDAQSIALGCFLYASHCAACHGTCGKGDGHAGYVLPKRPKDLTDSSYADDSDEDLLEVITYGKRSMPKYKRMLTETQRLQVIAYMRTLIVKNETVAPPKPSGAAIALPASVASANSTMPPAKTASQSNR